MKLQPDRYSTLAVQAHGPGWVLINGERIEHSVVISSMGTMKAWSCSTFSELHESHFALLKAEEPELVIFGSGHQLRFAHPALLRPLTDAGIGVETMSTLAAARTYNILAGEGRKVVAALLLDRPKS